MRQKDCRDGHYRGLVAREHRQTEEGCAFTGVSRQREHGTVPGPLEGLGERAGDLRSSRNRGPKSTTTRQQLGGLCRRSLQPGRRMPGASRYGYRAQLRRYEEVRPQELSLRESCLTRLILDDHEVAAASQIHATRD